MCIREEPPEGLEGISSRKNGGGEVYGNIKCRFKITSYEAI